MKLMSFGAALLLGGSALLASSPAAAADLEVPAGATQRLDPAQARARFDTWKLGDGATLVLPEGVEDWHWEVERAEIGTGVRILGAGAAAPLDPGTVIDIIAGPGAPGAGGRGGVGGKGGEGGYVQMRTLTGAQKWVAGGDRGRAGDPGANGESGGEGRALVEADVDRRLDRLLEQGTPPSVPAADHRLQDLERELEAMRRRLEALEREDGR